MGDYFFVLPILSFLLCVFLGVFTLSRNPTHPVNLGFVLGMLTLALIEAACAVILFPGSGPGAVKWGGRLLVAGQALLPPAWLVFTATFARPAPGRLLARWAPFLGGLLIISAVFIALSGHQAFITHYTRGALPDNTALFTLGPIGRLFYVYLILGLILNLINLENTLRSSTGTKRWHIKYLVFGVGGLLAFFIYLSSQALLLSGLNIQVLPVASAVTIICALVMLFFIVRHRLLEVEVFISRYVVYNSLTVLGVGLYLISVGLITYGINYFEIPFNYFFTTLFVFISVLSLFIILFTAKLRRKVQLFINRNFYSHKYEFRDKWVETTDRISSRSSVEDVVETLREMISETMKPESVGVWLYNPATSDFRPFGGAGPKFPPSHPLVGLAEREPAPFDIAEKAGELEDPESMESIKGAASEIGAVLCTPLNAGAELLGFVLQGPDLSGEPYMQDDHDLLKAVSTQAAVQAKNIRMAGEMADTKEVEAFGRMSSFVMHDLKNLANSLSLISQNARQNMDNPEFQKDAIETIEATLNRMKDLIERLSTLPRGLELKKSKADLKDIINNSVKMVTLPGDKDIVITESTTLLPSLYIDQEALEMVIMNLITNACDAIGEKGVVNISSSVSGENACITVEDDGPGIPRKVLENGLFRPFRSTKKNGFGIGLYQCKTIVEAHGGTIDVKSTEGKGTSFLINIPLI